MRDQSNRVLVCVGPPGGSGKGCRAELHSFVRGRETAETKAKLASKRLYCETCKADVNFADVPKTV